ncbi:MAG: alpha/beta hydrolase [Rhodospirillales bacterium]|nr:alpha/beta hydrolase [Rhodospirillales bacterium]MDP6642901.1 alpha/beta hydrolase [Rhodospirillales bacterium]MDP6842929.1 alpha/beta hydrolase [Rhodospirillales bacterium]
MKKPLFILFVLLVACAVAWPRPAGAGAKKTGIILLHGKDDDRKWIKPLAEALDDAGFLIATPLMPWSRDRIYDRSYMESLAQIDWTAKAMKKLGAERIFVAGHSLGANVALGYGSRRTVPAGIILLAPAHLPSGRVFAKRTAQSRKLARQMVAQGKGREKREFIDFNQGRKSTVTTTADIYLSWFAPGGPANMQLNARALTPRLPVLWVAGDQDHVASVLAKRMAYGPLTMNQGTKYVEVAGRHLDTPARAAPHIVAWIKELDKSGK